MNSSLPERAERLLPGFITAIKPQKNRRQRYSIFVEEEFLLGISESVLLEYNLERGTSLSVEQFRAITRDEHYHEIRHYFLNLLGRREHSRFELKQKARKKSFNAETIENVLDELEQKGWIDHEAFAHSFIRDKFRMNKWGPRKIANTLKQKGIERTTAQKLTENFFDTVDIFETFNKLIEKKRYKFNREDQSFRKRKKVFDYLRRKGYHTQQISSHLDRLMQSLDQ